MGRESWVEYKRSLFVRLGSIAYWRNLGTSHCFESAPYDPEWAKTCSDMPQMPRLAVPVDRKDRYD
eukprot:6185175-Pleurochrysis_carterae.AAC.3